MLTEDFIKKLGSTYKTKEMWKMIKKQSEIKDFEKLNRLFDEVNKNDTRTKSRKA